MGGERVDSEIGVETEELERWVDEKAEELSVDRSEVVDRALAASRFLDAGEDSLTGGSADFDAELDDLDDRVAALEADLDAKVADLRERVIQVKREADELAARGDSESETDAVSDLGESISTLESRVEAGFENYEEVLEYLVDAADENGRKLEAVASAVVGLRRRMAAVERGEAERTAATELKREANRQGVTDADCEACGESVALALLDAPYCPHCEETFDGVRGTRRFLPFGSATLTTGRRPALERRPDPEDDPSAVFDGTSAPDDAAGEDGAADPAESTESVNSTESGESDESGGSAESRDVADPSEIRGA